MKSKEDYIKDISEIRSIMERSSRFISLSGLSGVMAGVYALVASYLAYRVMYVHSSILTYRKIYVLDKDTLIYLFLVAVITLLLSVVTGIYLTTRKAKKDGLKIWEEGSKKLLVNLLIPLISGGVFIIAVAHRGYLWVVPPASLLFYGLALVNASKFTLKDVHYLGLSEIVLGLIATFYPGYGLIFWAVGFGILHILYGVSMYYKYER